MPLYPEAEAFIEHRRALDPRRAFLNDHLRELFEREDQREVNLQLLARGGSVLRHHGGARQPDGQGTVPTRGREADSLGDGEQWEYVFHQTRPGPARAGP
jgi:hypothetical protein